jgi:hypothetical protein
VPKNLQEIVTRHRNIKVVNSITFELESSEEVEEKFYNNERKVLKWKKKSWHQIQTQICRVV